MKPARDRGSDPHAIDLPALCRNAQTVQGEWTLASLERLAAGLAAVPDGVARWSAQGSLLPQTGGEPQLWLQVDARAQVLLQCQRCLQPMSQALVVDRRIRFVRGEDEAARLDEESDDDVLALPPRLDLQALVEDELILALPLVPRHDSCPEPLPLPADETDVEEAPANPFAALAALRGRTQG